MGKSHHCCFNLFHIFPVNTKQEVPRKDTRILGTKGPCLQMNLPFSVLRCFIKKSRNVKNHRWYPHKIILTFTFQQKNKTFSQTCSESFNRHIYFLLVHPSYAWCVEWPLRLSVCHQLRRCAFSHWLVQFCTWQHQMLEYNKLVYPVQIQHTFSCFKYSKSKAPRRNNLSLGLMIKKTDVFFAENTSKTADFSKSLPPLPHAARTLDVTDVSSQMCITYHHIIACI